MTAWLSCVKFDCSDNQFALKMMQLFRYEIMIGWTKKARRLL